MRVGPIGLICALTLVQTAHGVEQRATTAANARAVPVVANDNRRTAGTLREGTLTLHLIADQGDWQPEGPNGRTLTVQAFREESGPMTIPGPLVRVPVGTVIQASIRNDIPGTTLTVFGMEDRPAAGPGAGLTVPAGETRQVRFVVREPGTYHYWASTMNRPLRERFDADSQLGGALVVDPPGARAADRVFVISLWRKPGTGLATNTKPVHVAAINGRSWPHTERLDHRVGDHVRWRVVNLSFDGHAMHLHGNYFDVLATGDGAASHTYAPDEQRRVVTEHMLAGETIEMRWIPERAGNWLFHCHMVIHMTPPADEDPGTTQHHAAEASAGMAGLVLGIRVSGETLSTLESSAEPRRFTLRLREEPNRYGDVSGYRMDVQGLETTRLAAGPVPAPVIALTRGEPVEVALVNEMREPTAIHWHGIELDSYFDGVPGWAGSAGNVAPAIEPGRTFVAKFTPLRAGTFIYHTHWHDESQLTGGLYGALLVLEPGRYYDPATDHVFIVGYDGPSEPGQPPPYALNGSRIPAAVSGPVATPLRAGVPNRLRLINITPNNPGLTFMLTDGFKSVAWRPVAKDGADLPASQTASHEARQLVSVGETYDFEITPTAAERLWLEVRKSSGEWVAQALLVGTP